MNDKIVKYVDYTSDSVEFYPQNNQVFVCGTYEIEPGTTEYKERRKGKLYLYEIVDNDSQLKEIQTIEYPSGILDMKWSHNSTITGGNSNGGNLLGVVMSRGDLNLYQYTSENSLKVINQSQVTDSNDILALSLDWSLDNQNLVISSSDGNVQLVDMESVKVVEQWNAHDYEAWICAFNYFNDSVMFSGGDDCKFKMWDKRAGLDSSQFVKKSDSGVTSIHSNPHREHIIAQGSYDEKLRIWDLRSMSKPLVITPKLQGGVWRVKWHPSNPNLLVTACMAGGFHTLQSQDGSYQDLSILESYNDPHKSIAYGVDWSFKSSSNQKQHVACCSFYDKCLSIWNPKLIN
ncbi:WD40 repeat-containing protein [Tieghemostelium lacteum]|uniref:methylated diphthine methylhydrolase n=1 Tax=Tieghemostelium lacteum TaxID=361077 RepID=A0A151ZJV9_TIELA|nr:WD40 repeat-containing protein [Tieghemostelium lacteum]|eukprot:KYQ94189.1 WD40 repeat-containing protein [Tieghemostelium lacteum]